MTTMLAPSFFCFDEENNISHPVSIFISLNGLIMEFSAFTVKSGLCNKEEEKRTWKWKAIHVVTLPEKFDVVVMVATDDEG